MNGKSAGAAHRRGADAQGIDQLGGKVDFLATPDRKSPQVIRAEIVGGSKCAALGISARGPSPVLQLCRLLVGADLDPATPLNAYRDTTLCLRIRSIREAANLAISSKGSSFVRHRQEVRTASPVRKSHPVRASRMNASGARHEA